MRQTTQQMLAALCLLEGKEKGKRLFRFVSPDEEKELERVACRFQRSGLDRQGIRKQIENLVRYGQRLILEEIHPDWIREHLKNESPRVWALLSKIISSPKAEAVLSRLSEEERSRGLVSKRPPSPAILEIVRAKLEKKMGVEIETTSGEEFKFSDLVTLKGEDLIWLFKDLGIENVSVALSQASSLILKAFLTRFPLPEVAEIRDRIVAKESISSEERREAQRHLMKVSLGSVSPELFFLEIGFSIFSKALNLDETTWAEHLSQKFSKDLGYRLKRHLQERRCQKVAGDESLRELVFKRLLSLAHQGRIKRYWKEDREIETTVVFDERNAHAL